MIATVRVLASELRTGWKPLLLMGIVFALVFQVFMLLALMVRFQAWPNYINAYDWLANVKHIFASTPSWSDSIAIAKEEWLLEIGQIDYAYGTGLSIWSLNVIPSRIVVLVIMGVMCGLCLRLLNAGSCNSQTRASGMAMLGSGSLLVAMTNMTMSWVVCCATPTWVVGLAMLGLGVSTSLALETLGPALSYSGFGLLSMACIVLAWRRAKQHPLYAGALTHA